MRNLVMKHSIMLISIVGLFATNNTLDTIKPEEASKKDAILIIDKGITESEKAIDINVVIEEAKETVKSYNASVIEKNKTNKILLDLTKKELGNAKETSKLIDKLIKKYKLTKYDKNDNKTLSAVELDSICLNYRKPMFSKKKCTEWELTYYIYKGKERLNLETINIK